MARTQAVRVELERGQGATFVELFFDLVFVYAVTQLTAFVLHDLTWSGVGKATLLFWLVWWAWTQFTWTLNLADTEHVLVRIPVLAATAVAFFLAQGVPDAYGDAGLWFAISYVIVRLIGLGLQHWVYGGADRDTAALVRWLVMSTIGLVLVLAGGFAEGGARIALWGGALAADVVAAALAGRGTWEIAPGHFAERHGLIVIIALGESLIAAGVATAELERDAVFAVTTAGAVVATCALWWTYFERVHGLLEHQMDRTTDAERGAFGRDVYAFWHALVVGGVIGIAVGFEEAIAHPDHALEPHAAVALTVGLALFIGGAAGAVLRARGPSGLAPRVAVLVLLVGLPAFAERVAPAVLLWGVALLAVALAAVEHRGLGADPEP